MANAKRFIVTNAINTSDGALCSVISDFFNPKTFKKVTRMIITEDVTSIGDHGDDLVIVEAPKEVISKVLEDFDTLDRQTHKLQVIVDGRSIKKATYYFHYTEVRD